jgi:hypothetical protein
MAAETASPQKCKGSARRRGSLSSGSIRLFPACSALIRPHLQRKREVARDTETGSRWPRLQGFTHRARESRRSSEAIGSEFCIPFATSAR